MPLDVELADLRDFLASRGVTQAADSVALTFRPAGADAPTDRIAVRSGRVQGDRVVEDALLVVPTRPECSGLRLLAVDVETTGLDPRTDRIVAIGWVPVDGDRIDLARARRRVVLGDDPGAAAHIHGLTTADLVAGTPLPQVLAELDAALVGRVLLAHHARFDLAFLAAARRSVGRRPPRVAAVCTLALQRRLLRSDGPAPWPRGALRLWQARERYGLQPAPAHDALGDAVACAELFLAQLHELGRDGRVPLRRLVVPTGRPARLRTRLRACLRTRAGARVSGGWRSAWRRRRRPSPRRW